MSTMISKQELTDQGVKAAQPKAGRTRIWDTKAKGLALVIEPSGHKSYKAAYRFNGKLEWLNLGTARDDRNTDGVGVADARKAAKKALAKVTLGINPQAERRAAKALAKADTTFKALCERYIAEFAEANRRAWEQGEAHRKRYVYPKLGKRPIAEITRADIRAIFNELSVARKQPATGNAVLAAISAPLSWAVKQDLIPHNPAHGLEVNELGSRERVLSESEIPAFWRAFGDISTAGDVLKVVLLTGQRPGECRHMRGQDIELGEFTLHDHGGRPVKAQGGWWTLKGKPEGEWPGTKNGETNRVWLDEPVVAIIKKHMDGPGFVFRGERGPLVSRERLTTAMVGICDDLGIAASGRATPHDLRRTWTTIAASLGFSRDALDRILNHKARGVIATYDRYHYALEGCTIERTVAARIMALVENRTPDNVVELRASA